MHKSSLLLFSCVFAPDMAEQFGARAHREAKKKTQTDKSGTQIEGKEVEVAQRGAAAHANAYWYVWKMANCIGSDTNNVQSNWPKKWQILSIQDRQVKFSILRPVGWLGIVVAQQRQQIQQESIDRWPDS